MGKISNSFRIDEKENAVSVSANAKIYPLPAIFSAAYSLMDKAYVIIDGNPKKKIVVTLKPKKRMALQALAMLFNEQLLLYAVYFNEAKKSRVIREALVKKALLENAAKESSEELFIQDPKGIAVPWQSQKKK